MGRKTQAPGGTGEDGACGEIGACGRAREADVIVVGSGFGGSVAALRLSEKGYRVTVLEAGRRFRDEDFATSALDVRRVLWAPRLGCRGILRLRVRHRTVVLSGIGVGGGSLAYAGVHYRPPDEAFAAPGWDPSVDWAAELAPYYDLAEHMLGSTPAPAATPADAALLSAAERLGAGRTHHPTRVGIHLGPAGVPSPDPYFGGRGPARTGCTGCARCTSGCRAGAKNTLPKNYLHLAERTGRGARILPSTTVTGLRPAPDGRGWYVDTARGRTFAAAQVVLSAGAWGTAELLHRCRASGALPRLSAALGTRTCTNREVLLGVTGSEAGRGAAISSAVRPDDTTLVQLCRVRDLGRRTAVLFAMERRESTLTSALDRRGRLVLRAGTGPAEPTRLPAAEAVARAFAQAVRGRWAPLPLGFTAHLMGGCPLGTDPRTSVADPAHRVHGHPTLHIADASVVPANLGINPSLTITAMAERAFAAWPPAGSR
ncbi:GMC oxidoreductase [Streptomyces lycii]|uniref:Cholesterol oxidase n=1 Tax=Streptomyces lycii TaxID=2654337 RepID=A0ABQ7FHK9_9ACTN|nr:GMC family oxidoreductase [Streptomyces lycii]KAF4408496.1 GMC family oxidoreductase [Streptomyces lycii]